MPGFKKPEKDSLMSSDGILRTPLYRSQENESKGPGNNRTHDGSELQEHNVGDFAIRVSNLSKCYQIYDTPRDRLKQFIAPWVQRVVKHTPKPYFSEFWALRDVSFNIKRGETVGIIGRNGSGKSTLLQLICGTLTPTSGRVETNGRIAALLELGSGFNPEFTGRENVFMNGRILGLSQEEINDCFDDIAAFADIGEFIEQPVKTYSSGMFVRLAFAVQAHIDAHIVIVDEALAVGDVFFRQKCYARLNKLRESGTAILLVSHAMGDIEQFCEYAILLDHGEQKFTGPAVEATKHYYLLNQSSPTSITPVFEESREPENHLGSISIVPDLPFPMPSAFLNLAGISRIGNGKARCSAVALCNQRSELCNVFRQGETAVFHYEFELVEDIAVPIGGVVITNEKGVIVHGKNSWQYGNDVPAGLGPGSKIFFQHEIQLALGPGEYTFEVGLAGISMEIWRNRSLISSEDFSAYHERVCHLPNVGHFSVGLALQNGIAVLTHHGVADLPGKITMAAS